MKQTRFFAKKAVRLPQHPNVRKIYSFQDEVVFINLAAKPDAKLILFEPERPDPRSVSLPR